MKSNEIKNLEYNYGYALLKIWMSFEVVVCHFGYLIQPSSGQNVVARTLLMIISSMKLCAVPVFMLLSGMFMSGIFNVGGYTRKRLKRLVVPYLFWTAIYAIVYLLLAIAQKDSVINVIKDIGLQLLFGHTINQAMWFQVDLIILTMLFGAFVAVGLFNNHRRMIMLALIGFSFFIQYSGINYAIFSQTPDFMAYTLGRLFEVLPYFCTGLLLADFRDKLTDKTTIIILLTTAYIIWLVTNVVLSEEFFGFMYGGLEKYIVSVILVFIFGFLNILIRNECVRMIIYNFTKYTMGIYFVHNLVGRVIQQVFDENSLRMCLIVYILSLISLWGMSRIPYRKIQSFIF